MGEVHKFGFVYGLSADDIKQLFDNDQARLMVCVILLNFVAFVFISVDFAIMNDRRRHRSSFVLRPLKGPCCRNCSKHSGNCLRDDIITKEEISYRIGCAVVCGPAACLATRLATLEDPQYVYLAGFDGLLAAVYSVYAGFSAGMRKLKMDELKLGFPDLEDGSEERLKNS